VGFIEISFILLKARKKADGRLRAVRGSLTARVVWRAVGINEITFEQLMLKPDISKSYHHLIIKSLKVTASKLCN